MDYRILNKLKILGILFPVILLLIGSPTSAYAESGISKWWAAIPFVFYGYYNKRVDDENVRINVIQERMRNAPSPDSWENLNGRLVKRQRVASEAKVISDIALITTLAMGGSFLFGSSDDSTDTSTDRDSRTPKRENDWFVMILPQVEHSRSGINLILQRRW